VLAIGIPRSKAEMAAAWPIIASTANNAANANAAVACSLV
jgi:hypothetical protein